MTKPAANDDAGHFHAVKFYESHESLCRIVVEFLGEGMLVQQPALVIATPEHLEGIVTELKARHFNVDEMRAAGDLLLLDTSDMLAAFMVDGMPDADLFTTHVTRALEQVCRNQKGRTIRAYGEIVDVLWKSGQEVAAIRLEMMWNTLAMTHNFSLLCGYSMGHFYKDASLAAIHHQHSHVLAGQGLVKDARKATIN